MFAPGATGYFVYLANMGLVSFSSTTEPSLEISGAERPSRTVIMAYTRDTTGPNAGAASDSTANSSALLIAPPPPPRPVTTPEAASTMLLGAGLVAVGISVRRRR